MHSITFMGLDKDTLSTSPIYLDIKQFPLHNYNNNPSAKHKYVISEIWDNSNIKFKSRKMNYLCTLNPMTIEELEFTLEYEKVSGTSPDIITTMDGIFSPADPADQEGRAIIELVIESKG